LIGAFLLLTSIFNIDTHLPNVNIRNLFTNDTPSRQVDFGDAEGTAPRVVTGSMNWSTAGE
jgi:hypothetical protein